MHDAQFDVAVVGCGPVGACLANLLAQCGLTVLVLDKETHMYGLPRAVHFDDETMRVFQTVGIASSLAERVRVNPGMRFVDKNGNILIDWPRPSAVGMHGWHPSYRLHQPDLEQLLRETLQTHANVTAEFGVELVQLEQQQTGVVLKCRQSTSSKACQYTASYVVGCDGAGSIVRSLMQAEFTDFGYHERWLVVDVLLNHDIPDLGDYTLQFCDSKQPMTYCRNPGLRRRWEMSVEHLRAKNISNNALCHPDHIWPLLSRWITPEQAEIERSAVYTFRSAVVNNWQRNRLLLCGDAAHLTPPFMGQGLCAGIRDASNLAWKLALVVRQKAEDTLLESYAHERAPHVTQYIRKAIELGQTINALPHNPTAPSTSQPKPMSSIAPLLGESQYCLFTSPVADNTRILFSQPTLCTGVRLDDAIGYEWVLLTRTGFNTKRVDSGNMIDLSASANPEIASALDAHGLSAVLVRPDRYIEATATTPEQAALLAAMQLPTCQSSAAKP